MGVVSCLNPRVVRNRYTGELISVPCGKCPSCLTRSSALWTARLREESACHTYTLFGTLTYDDAHLPCVSLSDVSTDRLPDFYKAVSESSDYIKFCHGKIPCLNVKDVQDFFKKLRSKIAYHYGYDAKYKIRYFVCGEYGPTTFRPHYHYLLWFDAVELLSTIKRYIFEAWKSNTSHKTLSRFLERNKHRFVAGKAERYVAGYLNKSAGLPSILLQKPFRPWHVQSSAPPVGTIRVLKDAMERFVFGDALQVTLSRLSSLETVSVSLWRGLENRLFPKCIGFSCLTTGDRRTLYTISRSSDGRPFEGFAEFYDVFLSEWQASYPTAELLVKLCLHDSQGDVFTEEFRRSLKSVFNLSRRFYAVCESLTITPDYYLSRIEAYYSRKERAALINQLKIEERLSNNFDGKLQYYPFAIDTLFGENLRKLRSYEDYIKQFGLDSDNFALYLPCYLKEFEVKKNLCTKVLEDTHKVRIKKDYVANHPECFAAYSINLLNSKF